MFKVNNNTRMTSVTSNVPLVDVEQVNVSYVIDSLSGTLMLILNMALTRSVFIILESWWKSGCLKSTVKTPWQHS